MKKKLWGNSGKKLNLTAILTSTKFIVSFAAVLLVATLVAWTYHDTTNPDRVFWGMLDNNLQTSTYTRHIVQQNGSQSVDQVISANVSPKQVIYSETLFSQTGVDSAQAVTENIGTPTNDYIRYTSIQTSQKDKKGKSLDFSGVLNVWGITESEDRSQTTGQLFNQAVLSVIPASNLTATERRALVGLMKQQNAYSYKVIETTRSWPFGRPTYKISVTVKPVPYITALKQFAQTIGLNHLDEINPSDYKSAQQLSFDVSVDGWSQQMLLSSQSQAGRNEIISGRNLKKAPPAIPTESITADELQAKLQSIQ